MNVINRSAITVTGKKPFIDWNNALFPTMPIDESMPGNTYLINEITDDAGSVIKKYYKAIFEFQLEGICIDEDEWPEKRNFKLFTEWFNYEISDWVIDLSNKSMFDE
jgi:hypothetical protein